MSSVDAIMAVLLDTKEDRARRTSPGRPSAAPSPAPPPRSRSVAAKGSKFPEHKLKRLEEEFSNIRAWVERKEEERLAELCRELGMSKRQVLDWVKRKNNTNKTIEALTETLSRPASAHKKTKDVEVISLEESSDDDEEEEKLDKGTR